MDKGQWINFRGGDGFGWEMIARKFFKSPDKEAIIDVKMERSGCSRIGIITRIIKAYAKSGYNS